MIPNAIVLKSESFLDMAMSTMLAGGNANTQRAYRARIECFLAWRETQPDAPLLAHMKEYLAYLEDRQLSPRTIQQHISTIKNLFRTAAALEPSLAAGLPQLDLVKAPPVRGTIQGERLNEKQRQALIDYPGTDTHKGRRDTAILALLAVCGLRRSEVAGLTWGHLAELDGHHVIKNLSGKHGRVRTIKLPVALWRAIVRWGEMAGLDTSPDAPLFVVIYRGDHIAHGQPLSDWGISFLVRDYVSRALLGIEGITPHDLRRTAASLARKGGATIEKVQSLLGHSSPQTTSQYIGEGLDLDDNAVDYGKVSIP